MNAIRRFISTAMLYAFGAVRLGLDCLPRDKRDLHPREFWTVLLVVAGLAAPTMAAHVQESPAHEPTRRAFHALHESLGVDSLRSSRHMSRDARPANARTREGDLK
jgi:hypothetical protein